MHLWALQIPYRLNFCKKTSANLVIGLCDSGSATSYLSKKHGSVDMQRLTGIINAISIVVFPAILIVFEIAYWSFYNPIRDQPVDDLVHLHPWWTRATTREFGNFQHLLKFKNIITILSQCFYNNPLMWNNLLRNATTTLKKYIA